MLSYFDNYLKINGEKSTDYGLYISGSGTYYAPRKKRQKIDIPGRNGALIIEEDSYENAPHVYRNALIINADKNIEKLRNWFSSLKGYFRLEDTYHPNEFLIASFEGPFDPVVWKDGSVAKFDLEFDRKPQRYLKSGETAVEFTQNGRIENPTLFESEPLIRVYGNGTLVINDSTITTSGVTDYVDIDSEIEDCYRGSANLNSKVSLDSFPKLVKGSNPITIGSGITKIIITPRWWTL